MREHEQRVVTERDELADKSSKLSGFMTGKIYDDLPYEDRKLLEAQNSTMQSYVTILNMRISRFI